MLEVCVESAVGAAAAAAGGADFIELCSSLAEGGLTPSAGLLSVAQSMAKNVKINVMIRCRTGSDFHYSDIEMDTMLADVEIFKTLGVDGFVFGALTKDKEIDQNACAKILKKTGSIPVTFHRAFDVCKNPIQSLELLIELGFKKLLTSGQKSSACDPEAVDLLKELVERANSRITIMPGAGITEKNVYKLAKTGAKYFHSSCKIAINAPTVEVPAMGTNESKHIFVTDEVKVKELKRLLKEIILK